MAITDDVSNYRNLWQRFQSVQILFQVSSRMLLTILQYWYSITSYTAIGIFSIFWVGLKDTIRFMNLVQQMFRKGCMHVGVKFKTPEGTDPGFKYMKWQMVVTSNYMYIIGYGNLASEWFTRRSISDEYLLHRDYYKLKMNHFCFTSPSRYIT